MLKLYTSKLPPKTRQDPEAVFYWKPKEKVPLDATAAWFLIQPVGRNTLASMVKNMCSQIGVTGKTNHSLRATGNVLCTVNAQHHSTHNTACVDEMMKDSLS